MLFHQKEYETWNVGMTSPKTGFFSPTGCLTDIFSQFPIRILLESSFPLSVHDFNSSQTKSKWCCRAQSYKIRVLFCTSGENSIPLMFFWMLIPMTPLSSRSIFPLLVINSFDSYKEKIFFFFFLQQENEVKVKEDKKDLAEFSKKQE